MEVKSFVVSMFKYLVPVISYIILRSFVIALVLCIIIAGIDEIRR